MLGVYKIQNKIFFLLFKRKGKKKARAKIVTLENKFKKLEQNLNCFLDYKNKLKQIYEEKANGVKIRSKSESVFERTLI